MVKTEECTILRGHTRKPGVYFDCPDVPDFNALEQLNFFVPYDFEEKETLAQVLSRTQKKKSKKLDFEERVYRPRGLINNGNQCFLNSVLQPLFRCPPFFNFVLDSNQSTPLIEALSDLAKEFMNEGKHALSADTVYDAMRISCQGHSFTRGHQEDAEEALGFLLDGLHSELKSSEVTSIFGGVQENSLRIGDLKPSIVEEQFRSLQVVIEPKNVSSVQDALEHLFKDEEIEEYPLDGQLVKAKRKFRLKVAPICLVIVIKRFQFQGTVSKINKHVSVPLNLKLNSFKGQQDYRLFAVVNHHGRGTEGGHYTCDCLESIDRGTWIHMDDTDLRRTTTSSVLAEKSDRKPYLLFYEKTDFVVRCDSTFELPERKKFKN